MSATNGTAAMPPPVNLGALVPKTYPVLIERNGRGFLESVLDAVRFVPMTAGKA